MNVINIEHLTKDYGNGKGIFDVSLTIPKGEVYGYLGPNGAGKSTTMRHLMGFSKPEKGSASIYDLDCWKHQTKIQKILGYLPGEIAFPDDMTGYDYLHLIGDMRKMKDFSYAHDLLARFEINPNAPIKRMSKGMKQKIGITSAFMHDPDILLLDEPTSGLDPLMQQRFIELVKEEKEKGKTILLSSHIFEEIEKACDRVGFVRNGEMIREIEMKEFRHARQKTYKVEFTTPEDLNKMMSLYQDAEFDVRKMQMQISILDSQINDLLRALSKVKVRFLREEKHTLEDYFMQFYGGETNV